MFALMIMKENEFIVLVLYSNIVIKYRYLNKLNKFISAHKDTNQFTCNNNITYKVNCKDCNVSYVE